ncbi:hypothetical protein [Chloroflexus sp. Y-396-1]|uniref:hypothetical protein n=1 Tax=Chloroflexus sp. Y-396-1 TaxID=867845 RepID=UPI0004BB7256|nr:hypothetical protein [Chloroflexus sp. Y-396-1]
MRLALAVFFMLSGFYLLTMSGHTYSADEETMLAVTRSLLERGDVAVVVEDGAPVVALRPGRDGNVYSPYGILPSLLAIPLHLLGTIIAHTGSSADYASRFTVTMLNGLLTAATCAVIARWAQQLGATIGWSLVLALIYGLSTFAWVYARTFFSEPLAALLLLSATYYAWSAFQSSRTNYWQLFVSGLLSGLLLVTRIAAAVALPIIALYILWELSNVWLQYRLLLQMYGIAVRRWHIPRSVFIGVLSWMVGLLPGLALFGWYNLARFATPIASGYESEAFSFTTPLGEGLFGLLLSPGKSVFLYAPALLLALPGGIVFWRRGKRALVLIVVGLFLSHLFLYACWAHWPGGGVWGPRFLLPVVAPVIILASSLFMPTSAQQLKIGLLILVLVLSTTGFIGNLGGVLLNFDTYVVSTPFHNSTYTIAESPLVGHWRLLFDRWARYRVPPPFCQLGDGIYAGESTDGAIFPRRTGPKGEFACLVNSAARITLILDDQRPVGAPDSQLRLRLNGYDQGRLPSGQRRLYHLRLPSGWSRLEVVVQPWNPLAIGFSDRDEPLGPIIVALYGQTDDDTRLAIVDTAVAPLPARPNPRWAWYYEPANQHLIDHWLWYLPRSELTTEQALRMGGLIILTGTINLIVGIGLLVMIQKPRERDHSTHEHDRTYLPT